MRWSEHAQERMRQRGVRNHDLLLFLAWADHDTPSGRLARVLSLSAEARREMLADGVAPQRAERVASLAAVVAAHPEVVVTVYHTRQRRAVRRRGRT